MRVIFLPTGVTILVDILAWAMIHPLVAYAAMRFPTQILDPTSWLFRSRAWEQGGWVYDRLFRVTAWKKGLPAGGVLSPGGFSMRRLESREDQYLRMWVRETCRSELCHWLSIPPAFLFFLWNPFWVGWLMVAYAVVFNAFPIIAQRHNRPRLLALLHDTVYDV